MKKTYIILFGAALLLGSCTRNPETDEPTPPHASSGLVIKASCTPATRTDIIEGKSTWEVGDRITVVYDGTAYVYTATEAGATTTFASDTGITAYDPSKPLTAYYPVTTVEGTVAVEPQRTCKARSRPTRPAHRWSGHRSIRILRRVHSMSRSAISSRSSNCASMPANWIVRRNRSPWNPPRRRTSTAI